MEELEVRRATKALGLKRQIIGVRFLVFQKDYMNSPYQEIEQTTLCQLAEQAGNGEKVKAKAENINCLNGACAVGLHSISEEQTSGLSDFQSGNYESRSIARKIFANKEYIDQKIYGIEFAPIETMGAADIAMFLGTAKDIMRIMQGYVRYYGVAKNVITVANGGICSELISKPFMNNDINLSLLSSCAREKCNFSSDEMGISMPIHYLENVLKGILETVNLTENNRPKQEILQRLEYPGELGFSIRMNYDYAIQGMEYRKYCEECRKEQGQIDEG